MIRKCSFFASPISSAAENKQFEFVLSLISLNVKSMQLMVKIKVVSLCVAFLYFSYDQFRNRPFYSSVLSYLAYDCK